MENIMLRMTADAMRVAPLSYVMSSVKEPKESRADMNAEISAKIMSGGITAKSVVLFLMILIVGIIERSAEIISMDDGNISEKEPSSAAISTISGPEKPQAMGWKKPNMISSNEMRARVLNIL